MPQTISHEFELIGNITIMH